MLGQRRDIGKELSYSDRPFRRMDKSRSMIPRLQDRVAEGGVRRGKDAHDRPGRRLKGLRLLIKSAICRISERLSCGAPASRKGRTSRSATNMPTRSGTLRIFTKVDHQAIGANRIRSADPAICKTKKMHQATVTYRV